VLRETHQQATLIGHNGGPPLEDHLPRWGRGNAYRYFCWKNAHARAWKSASSDIALFRLKRAEAAGVSYRDYMLALLDTGRHLQGPKKG